MYVALVTLGLCAAYCVLFLLVPYFFKGALVPMRLRSLLSLLFIVVLSAGAFVLSGAMPTAELNNRALHTLGGGFLAVVICLLVVKDIGLGLRGFQFFVFSVLVALALGVLNEIVEYLLQGYGIFSFAKTANDTWLDLISNTGGALLGAVLCTPFVRERHH